MQPDPGGPPLLELKSLSASYGEAIAVADVSFAVPAGRIVAIVGPNGAGKSSTLKAIAGLLPTGGGEIWFDGRSLAGVPGHRRTAAGLALVPEGRRVFPHLSVAENLAMGAYGTGAWGRRRELADGVIRLFPRLGERRSQYAGTLSGGEQQMLAIGRALMAEPRILMLDEPSLGLAPRIVEQIFETVLELNRAGLAVLLVEQNARLALRMATEAYVMESGQIVRGGPASDLASDDDVRAAYFGS